MVRKTEGYKCSNPVCNEMSSSELDILEHEKTYWNLTRVDGLIFEFDGNTGTNYGVVLPKKCSDEKYPVAFLKTDRIFSGMVDRVSEEDMRKLWVGMNTNFLEEGEFRYFVENYGIYLKEELEGMGLESYIRTVDGWTRNYRWDKIIIGKRDEEREVSGEGIAYRKGLVHLR